MTKHKDKALAMTAAQMTAVAICSLLWTGLAVTTRYTHTITPSPSPSQCAHHPLLFSPSPVCRLSSPPLPPTHPIVSLLLLLCDRNPDLSVLMDPVHIGAMAYTGLVTSAFAVVVESVALSYVPVEVTLTHICLRHPKPS